MRKKGWDVNKNCYRLLVWSGMRFDWQATRGEKTVWQMEVLWYVVAQFEDPTSWLEHPWLSSGTNIPSWINRRLIEQYPDAELARKYDRQKACQIGCWVGIGLAPISGHGLYR